VDGAADTTDEDAEVLRLAAESDKWIAVYSKKDLRADPPLMIGCSQWKHPPAAVVSLSSLTGEGLDKLEAAVRGLFPAGDPRQAGSLLTDARQEDAVRRAREALVRAREAFLSGMTPDAVLTDAEEALSALGELTGRTAREDIVSRIFSRFCVGK